MSEQQGTDIEVTWDEARATNLANWNDRVAIHVTGYDIERYVDDPDLLSHVVKTDLVALQTFLPKGVRGLDVCHLQCHIGTDTVSLARAGARVTGVDFSEPALEVAAGLATRLGLDAQWVLTDVLDARAAVSRQLGADRNYDLVYTSIGTVGWLGDLTAWATQIAALLKPGGLFYFRDGHPFLFTIDDESETAAVKYRYFNDGRAQVWDDESSYVGEGTLEHPRTLEYAHPVSEIVNALIDAGLQILRLDEGDTLPWEFSKVMLELPDGDFAFPDALRDVIPVTLTVVARKP
jgi:2-polyprenyl-3-methyl-5-hydroxy-6-metoxy-1,4-benzoquinol methylase